MAATDTRSSDTTALSHSSDWPPSLVAREDRLVFDGCDVESVARRYGTPLWLVSLPTVVANYRRFVSLWSAHYPAVECAYSLKANHTLAVVRTLASAGAKMDCSGETEYRIALMVGAKPSDCILNGNGKSQATLNLAASNGCRQVNIDSVGEVMRLNELAAAAGSTVDCVVRVQMDYQRLLEIDPDFTPIIRIWEGKFGTSKASGETLRVIEKILAAPNLRFVGLHHHVGFSGVGNAYDARRDVMHHNECTRELCEFAREIGDRFGIGIERLDLGGGFPPGKAMYLATPGNVGDGALRSLPDLEEYVKTITEPVKAAFSGNTLPVLQFETGRWQVANAAIFVASVVDVKDDHSTPPRRFVTVDGSMYQFTTKGFTNLAHQAIPATDVGREANGRLVDIVGQTCAYDSIVEDFDLPDVAPGDVLAFTNHGAYSDTSGTNFNAIPRPGTVAVDHGRCALVKRHETLEDVVGRCIDSQVEWIRPE